VNLLLGMPSNAIEFVYRISDGVRHLMAAGGPVMIPLLMVGIFVWTLIGTRFFAWIDARRIHSGRLREFVKQASGWEVACLQLRSRLYANDSLIRTLVAVAPLLGLLGTVSGMMVTFDGISNMSFFSQQGGIAGGISEALLTTQTGLVIAVPAFITSRILQRKIDKQMQRFELMIKEPLTGKGTV
jgi:biopolymer transport protein ExbB/TolQ